MWRAPDALSWAQAVRRSKSITGTRKCVSVWLIAALKGMDIEPLPYPLDVKSALTLLHLHIRCRRLGTLDDEWSADPQ